ncbi:MAG: hypothetical protein QOH46_1670 [Solirubrobacteraceae bacterium]|nr:hypothetical protein [Solirubrobacteraceae bacterium]
MRARWLGPLVALALPATAVAQNPPQPSPQALFESAIADDPATTPTVRDLLRVDAAFVAARPLFADLTGDGRADAVVGVQTPGAAGVIAVYALTSHGNADGALRVVLRSQALYRASARVNGAVLTVAQPRWARGDDLCCPTARAERDYVWDAARERLRRRGAERVIQLRD